MVLPLFDAERSLNPYQPFAHETSELGPLHTGANWSGTQRSGRSTYELSVHFDHVNHANQTCSGTMTIRNLTPALPSLCTFFTAEIIGETHPWITNRWGATQKDDVNHWNRFTREQQSETIIPRRRIFMRWKEHFVVSQNTTINTDRVGGENRREGATADNIHGASFAGFYYTCLDLGVMPPSAFLHRTIHIARSLSISSPLTAMITLPSPQSRSLLSSSTTNKHTRRRFSTGSIQTYAEILKTASPPSSPTLTSSTFDTFSFTPSMHHSAILIPLPGECSDEEFPFPIITALVSVSRQHRSSGGRQTRERVETSPHRRRVENFNTTSEAQEDMLEESGKIGNVEMIEDIETERNFLRESGRIINRHGSTSDSQRDHSPRPIMAAVSRKAETEGGKVQAWSRATISGFYFHAQSEPYQQLSLHYVQPTRCNEVFEFR